MISMLKIHDTVEYEKLYMEFLKLIRCLLLSTNIPKEDFNVIKTSPACCQTYDLSICVSSLEYYEKAEFRS